MTRRTFPAAAIGALALILVACGGGGGDNGAAPTGSSRISDPAAAPIAARSETEAPTYVFRGDTVSAPSGATTTLSGEGSSTTGGTGGGTTNPGSTYTVEPGDSCGAIASRVGIELTELMSANPQIDANCSNLQPGQELRIPGGTATNGDDEGSGDEGSDDEGSGEQQPAEEPAAAGGQTHTVASGEICGTIADMYGVDVDEMVALNGLDCNNLQIDQVIQIP